MLPTRAATPFVHWRAPGASDSEPLVGPVAAQRVQMLTTLEVPERDGPYTSC